MNKLAILFGTTTVAFGGLTFYYASELRKEDDFFDAQTSPVRPATAPAPAAAPAPSDTSPIQSVQNPTPDAITPGTSATVSNAPSPQSATAANNPASGASGKPAAKMSASDIDFLAMYADPQGRRTLIEEAMVDTRNARRGLAEWLGLGPDQWQRLTEVLAEQLVEARAASLRCRADPACKSPFTPDQLANRQQAVIDAIGEDKRAEYERYMSSMQERQAVAELQKQLSGDLALPPDRAEALVAALADERAAAYREMTADGRQVSAIGVPNGYVYYDASAPTLEARMESGARYSQRMRDRAATVLSGNQLKTFNQMQDQLLATLRAYLVRNQPEPPKPQGAVQKTAQT